MNAAATALLERARREQQELPENEVFEHLLAKMPKMMRPDQVAEITGWSRTTIYLLCETGEKPGDPPYLEIHELPGRDRSNKQISRRSVAAFLLRSAKYRPDDFPSLLRLTLPTLTPQLLREMRDFIEAEFTRREPPQQDRKPLTTAMKTTTQESKAAKAATQ